MTMRRTLMIGLIAATAILATATTASAREVTLAGGLTPVGATTSGSDMTVGATCRATTDEPAASIAIRQCYLRGTAGQQIDVGGVTAGAGMLAVQANWFLSVPIDGYDVCVQALVDWLPEDLTTLTDVQCF
jgi:hypothetical protein